MSDTPEDSFTIKHETSDTKGRYVVELNGAKAQGELFRGYLADLDTVRSLGCSVYRVAVPVA